MMRQCAGVMTESALTIHLVMPAGYPGDVFMDGIMQVPKDRFAIAHSTLQVEQGTTDHACALHSPLEGAISAHAH